MENKNEKILNQIEHIHKSFGVSYHDIAKIANDKSKKIIADYRKRQKEIPQGGN